MTNLELFNNINPNIILYKGNYYLLISNLLGYQNNPAFGLLVLINDKLFEIDNDIQIFLHSLQNSDIEEISNILAEGIENEFEIGKNYFLTFSLWEYLMTFDNDSKIKLLRNDVNDYRVNDYFDSQYNKINTDIYSDIDDTDLKYFYFLNKLNTFTFTEDELKNFISTFCGIILDETTFTDITDTKNLIYKQVLEYYRNNGKDSTSTILDLVFNNTLLTTSSNSNSTCCNNLQNNIGISSDNLNLISTLGNLNSPTTNISCVDVYKQAMQIFLKKMLGDYQFYCDWFYINGNNSKITVPNMVLINKLKELFEEFKELNYPLYWGSETSKCGCRQNNGSLNSKIQNISDSNYKILDNYYNILLYAEDCIINENKNKVKVYGENFADLFPYLYFI